MSARIVLSQLLASSVRRDDVGGELQHIGLARIHRSASPAVGAEVLADDVTRDLKTRLGSKAETFYPWMHDLLRAFLAGEAPVG